LLLIDLLFSKQRVGVITITIHICAKRTLR